MFASDDDQHELRTPIIHETFLTRRRKPKGNNEVKGKNKEIVWAYFSSTLIVRAGAGVLQTCPGILFFEQLTPYPKH